MELFAQILRRSQNSCCGHPVSVAEEEARAISARTKAALAAAVARAIKLGGPGGAAPLVAHIAVHGNAAATEGAIKKADEFARDMRPFIEPYVMQGLTDKQIANRMNDDGTVTRRIGGKWHETSVRRLRERLAI